MDQFTFLNEQISKIIDEEKEEKVEEDCCMFPNIMKDAITYEYSCRNCGLIIKDDIHASGDINYVDMDITGTSTQEQFNPRFETEESLRTNNDRMMTRISLKGYSSKTSFNIKSLNRIHLYNQCNTSRDNYYRTDTLYKTYTVLDKMMKRANLDKTYIKDYVKYKYKELYMGDNGINSRANIKRGLYLWCIISVIIENDIDYPIMDLFKIFCDIKIAHYNKANLKLTDDFNKYIIHESIPKITELLQSYKLDITDRMIIKEYNKYINRINMNQKSILYGCIYNLCLRHIGMERTLLKLFSKTFHINASTIRKFNKCIKDVVI